MAKRKEKPPSECKTDTWHGCYDGGWNGLIVPEAFAHPAKFSYRLVQRIISYGLSEGFWQPGDLIGDPFGGVALGGIICGYAGLNWRGVELEPRFVDLGNQNLDMHRSKWAALGNPPTVRLVQGDSRRFASLVGEVAGCVTSPPYAEGLGHGGMPTRGDGRADDANLDGMQEGYGTTPGQIGALPAGSIDGAITSPPWEGARDTSRTCNEDGTLARQATSERGSYQPKYGQTAGQIGSLPSGHLDGVVTSPPWNKGAEGGVRAEKFKDPEAFAEAMSAADGKNGRHYASPKARKAQLEREAGRIYGRSDGQIGNQSGETYWQAMAQVYGQMRLAMRSGAIAAIVVKDYVKAAKSVPLCDQTCQLLESIGFTVFLRVQAMLVKTESNPGLFGHVTKEKARKSFFRRLAEKKGSPKIDFEEVIFARNF